jgi:hypothetical protein
MAIVRFPDYQPQLQLVNSGGTVIEGPYQLDVKSGAPASLGITLGGAEPWYVEENIGPFLNYQWSEVAYNLGYRYFVTLNFSFVESGQTSTAQGLTLLDRLHQACVKTQVTYAALQFSLFVSSPFFGVVPAGSNGFHPQKVAGKQGFYDLSLSFKSRDLQATPGAWASSLW